MIEIGGPIDAAIVLPYTVPLRHPVVVGSRSVREREGCLLALRSGPYAGWGEAAPLPGLSRETVDDAREALDRIATRVRGRDVSFSDPVAGSQDLLDESPPPSVRYAVELALVNLAAAVRGVSAARVLAPDPEAACTVAALVSGPESVDRAQRLADLGFAAVKLKVGRSEPDHEARFVLDVAERVGPSISLRLDANRRWTLDRALRFMEAIGSIDVEFVEEPVRKPDDLPAFAARSRVPFALDESLVGSSPERLEPAEGLGALVLKPTVLGGIGRCMAFARRAATLDAKAVVSASFEAGPGLYGLVDLAASLPAPRHPAGIGTADFLAGSITDPPVPVDSPTIAAGRSYRVTVPGGEPF